MSILEMINKAKGKETIIQLPKNWLHDVNMSYWVGKIILWAIIILILI